MGLGDPGGRRHSRRRLGSHRSEATRVFPDVTEHKLTHLLWFCQVSSYVDTRPASQSIGVPRTEDSPDLQALKHSHKGIQENFKGIKSTSHHHHPTSHGGLIFHLPVWVRCPGLRAQHLFSEFFPQKFPTEGQETKMPSLPWPLPSG